MRTFSIVLLLGLAFVATARGQVAPGEIEKRSGFVASALKESAHLFLITLSESESDGPVRVGYLMKADSATKLPQIKGAADVEYKGLEYLRVRMKDKEGTSYLFSAESQDAGASQQSGRGIGVIGIERFGLKPDAFPNHASAVTQLFQLFNDLPKRRGRDAKRPLF